MSTADEKLKVVEGFTIVNFVLLLLILVVLLIFVTLLMRETNSVKGNVSSFVDRLKVFGGTVGQALAQYYLK